MRILFVAMADSIHPVRWIRQILPRNWELHLFASTTGGIHKEHREITVHGFPTRGVRLHDSVRVRWRWPLPYGIGRGLFPRMFPGYFDTAKRLARLIERVKPDVVHSMEIQHGGYLTLEARKLCRGGFPPWIVTNYGNCTYYFRRFREHMEKLREVYAECDYCDCECERDVVAAKELGFRGTTLPVTPNTGGFDLDDVATLRHDGPTSTRRQIMLKGYDHWYGRALTGLSAIERCHKSLKEYAIRVYSSTQNVRDEVENVRSRTGLDIACQPECSHREMLRMHGHSRMSIGVSASDGVATSFLEALVMGSFPIQTCTACADEWVEDGVGGFVVPPNDHDAIAEAIHRAATDDLLVDRAAEINARTAAERLDHRRLCDQAIGLYERVVADRTQRSAKGP